MKTRTLRAGSRIHILGFTLLELLVVMTIAAVLVAAVSTQLFSGTASLDLRSAAGELADVFRRARGHAIARNTETAVVLDLDARKFGLFNEGPASDLPKDLEIHLLTATQELLSEARGTIRFYPDGTSSGGGVLLARAGKSYTVGVRWLTGQVWVSEQAYHAQ